MYRVLTNYAEWGLTFTLISIASKTFITLTFIMTCSCQNTTRINPTQIRIILTGEIWCALQSISIIALQITIR